MRGLSSGQSGVSVLRDLIADGPTTRPAIAARLNLSKPTVSAAIQALAGLGYVVQVDSSQGSLGRSAAVFGLGQRAGYAVGLDIGVTRVRVRATDLHGRIFHKRDLTRRGDHRDDERSIAATARHQLTRLLNDLEAERGQPRAVAVAVPHTVRRPLGGQTEEDSLQRRLHRSARAAGLSSATPVIVENNVNCSAVAEQNEGCARERSTFAVLQVGVRVGAAFVNEGHLVLGANGVAGEPAYIPFPWTPGPGSEQSGEPTHLENYLGADGFMERVTASWPTQLSTPPRDVEDLARRAVDVERPDQRHALECVSAHAQGIGQVACAMSALLDPGLIVLSGGVGSNPAFAEGVRQALTRLPWRTDVEISSLGGESTVMGATRLAMEQAVAHLLDEAAEDLGRASVNVVHNVARSSGPQRTA